jgi:hypothetical protein
MLGGSWTRAPRMMAALAVVLALGTAGEKVADAADTPNAPTSSASPPAATPPAASPPAASPAARSSAEAQSTEAPPPAAPPSTPPPAATELDGPAPRTQSSAGGSTQSGMAGCAVWTDRCIICQRDSGVVACSNIGIACQPQPLMCLRQEAAPEKKQPN